MMIAHTVKQAYVAAQRAPLTPRTDSTHFTHSLTPLTSLTSLTGVFLVVSSPRVFFVFSRFQSRVRRMRYAFRLSPHGTHHDTHPFHIHMTHWCLAFCHLVTRVFGLLISYFISPNWRGTGYKLKASFESGSSHWSFKR